MTGVSPALFRRQQLWMKLAVYRPLAVLAGIWVGLIAIALLAYGQLMHATTDSAQETPAAPTASVYPHERGTVAEPAEPTEPAPPPTPVEGAERSPGSLPEAAPTAEVTAPATAATGLSGWTLMALVGTCALGCWLLSVQLKTPRRPKRNQPSPQAIAQSRLIKAPQGTVSAPRPQPPGPQRLAPYDPTQPLVAAAAAPLPPPAVPPAAPAPAPAVQVVADDLTHPLDWPTDSLVNTADVRQRRSLSSFM